MSDTLEFLDIQERLQKLEEAFADHNGYQFKKGMAELRRTVKMRANAAALVQAELLDCRKESERTRKQCVDLQAKLKTVVDRFEGSFTAFEKFRKAIRVVELMRSHEDLPAILERIKELFGLRAVSLLLDAGGLRHLQPARGPAGRRRRPAPGPGRTHAPGQAARLVHGVDHRRARSGVFLRPRLLRRTQGCCFWARASSRRCATSSGRKNASAS